MKEEKFSAKMTNAEKAKILQGIDFMYTNSIERLGIPRLSMADGPHGLRKQIDGGDNGVSRSELATAFPASACVASSWNPENAEKIGKAISEECRYYGVHMLLGPGVNIKRNPLGGRNFEYYSEDPLLSGKMGAFFVRGLQKNGTSACVKHFAVNNQENFRFMGNSVVDERAMREIYLKSFETVIKEGKPGAVMSSYNRINGTFASENKQLLSDILRSEWGFDGIVMSDWGGTHDRVDGIRAGEDLEMPGDTEVCLKTVYKALEDGALSSADTDRCIDRILTTVNSYTPVERADSFDNSAHAAIALDVAADSAVLMKNAKNVLPLDSSETLCVIGDLFTSMRYQGAGSSMITPTGVKTHKDAFDIRGIKYEYARGYCAGFDKGSKDFVAEAIRIAQKYDTVLLYLGLTDFDESEGGDRAHMRLPKEQTLLADALVRLGKKTIVILSGGSPVELPFAEGVDAILNLYLPGQCGGEAGTRLIFGETNPSGKLAETWYDSYFDVPYGAEYSRGEHELYKESIFVGYRYAQGAGVKPRFPFGFGLSYTAFSYESIAVTRENGYISVIADIRNSGERDGAEVVQLYVKNNADSAVFKPKRELRAFTKVYLTAKECKTVTLTFAERNLSFWNPQSHEWELENGTYIIELGASSEDIRLSEQIEITSGVKTNCPYSSVVNETLKSMKPLDDAAFEELIGYSLPMAAPALPLTAESRFCDFKQTVFGKILYKAVCCSAEKQLKEAIKMPPSPERDNRIKGAVFLQRIFDTNCLRSLSMSAGKQFPWNVAEGFVEIGNGHLIRGIAAICKKNNVKGAVK